MADRAARLERTLNDFIHGKRQINARQDASLFLEAVSAHSDPPACVDKIIASTAGVACVKTAARTDLSDASLNGRMTDFLSFLQHPTLKVLASGSYLRRLVTALVESQAFWRALLDAFQRHALKGKAEQAFAWLLLQLVSKPADADLPDFLAVAKDHSILPSLLNSEQLGVRTIAAKIQHIVSSQGVGLSADVDIEHGPGGRHDNDFVDFRQISILPTADEIVCRADPFLRQSAILDDPETASNRVAIYLDNQFRLLREDMLNEMREELKIASGKVQGRKHRSFIATGLKIQDVHCGPDDHRTKWALTLQCSQDLPQLVKLTGKKRKAYLIDNRTRFLRHQSLACLIEGDAEIVAFATINRDEDLLVEVPPVLVVWLEGDTSCRAALMKLKTSGKDNLKLLQIDAALFAYEPILRALQEKRQLPFSQELLYWDDAGSLISRDDGLMLHAIARSIRQTPAQDLSSYLGITKRVVLDSAQAEALASGLTQSVSLIQGPPGTGKSFIGALLAKLIYKHTSERILIVCYTNHALDQFVRDLKSVGIPQDEMVRIGGKIDATMDSMSLRKQKLPKGLLGRAHYVTIDLLKQDATGRHKIFSTAFTKYRTPNRLEDLFLYLEFEEPQFFTAFSVPEPSADGMHIVGARGKAIDKFYLFERWRTGKGPGAFKGSPSVLSSPSVWGMPVHERADLVDRWMKVVFAEQIDEVVRTGTAYNKCLDDLQRRFSQKDVEVLLRKRIIACTTTGAAKYRESINAAAPDVVLVEEAGEILESHVVTALGADTKQLILIGDHQQLRPKVNHYRLTVEKGEGYDLNRSLFERLVLRNYPHKTLISQHRMRPEIAQLMRDLTYRDLTDAPSTLNRPIVRGLRDNVIFMDHRQPEDEHTQISDTRDNGSTSSKQNTFEVDMVLKIVRYLGQQGYGTDKIVVLTPYLGQLHKLRDALVKENDPVLNDLDSFDLVRAGLITPSAAKLAKKRIRLATIDNYQGEESDIVIASLTRSNPDHSIGFMAARERATVLFSRARLGQIIIGNSETFLKSRQGGEVWTTIMDSLKAAGHLYDGLPVRCERHQDRRALLSKPNDFDSLCPDGGCSEPCGAILNCGVHPCPSKCHQLSDHSKMECQAIVSFQCPQGHPQSRRCHMAPSTCRKCEIAAKKAEEARQREFERQQQLAAEQAEHDKKLKDIDEQISKEREKIKVAEERRARAAAIRVKEDDLEALRATEKSVMSKPSFLVWGSLNTNPTSDNSILSVRQAAPSTPLVSHDSPARREVDGVPTCSNPVLSGDSQAEVEWKRQKEVDGSHSAAIDKIMSMVGLEEVKQHILTTKAKIDLSIRQNISTKKERFNAAFLGNPGTGKTTVARLYAQFLEELDVLPGKAFHETTGSRLANDGIPGAKKLIEDVVKAGGGTIFIDEAYQLSSGHHYQGAQVLDFLLAEMENQTGLIVFILVGYNKQMESFFNHNPGIPSRVPYNLKFEDYTDKELLLMLEKKVHEKYGGRMKVEDGIRGLYGRIAIRRLGRGRGRDGFGNARALENLLSRISERQAARIKSERGSGHRADDFLFVKEDLIGPDPTQALKQSKAWVDLQKFIGLDEVKKSIQGLFDLIAENYHRELAEKEPVEVSLNRVFLGSPGTGKTSVAKLYGRILADLGLLSNGEVVLKNPADFIGSVLGESEKNTKAILASSVGKVLIIDEAYMLYGGSGTQGKGSSSPYNAAVIDTMVAEIQSVPGEDRCVLLLGYKEQIEEMFQNVNPGLSRRFAIENAFYFADFDDDALLKMLELKLKTRDLFATDAAKATAMDVLKRERNRPNFGNGGAVENLLTAAKQRYMNRIRTAGKRTTTDIVFEPQDFDPDFDRDVHAADNLDKLFEDVVGCDVIVAKLKGYQRIVRNMKARGQDPKGVVPTNFVFKGPPGTGKTTTARKMGQVYCDMGFLATPEVEECSASDLVGEYVGQTGPKTQKLFEKALGRVLFIDEAYRLSEGPFAKEAIDEVVGIITNKRFLGKMVVILAGYDQEMNTLMAVNTGLSSRFPQEIVFAHLKPQACVSILIADLNKHGISCPDLPDVQPAIEHVMDELATVPGWGNARDVKTLAKSVANRVLAQDVSDAAAALEVHGSIILEEARAMLKGKRERALNVPATRELSALQQLARPLQRNQAPPPPVAGPSISTQVGHDEPVQETTSHVSEPEGTTQNERDPGVSDAVWKQLQIDKAAQEAARRRIDDIAREAIAAKKAKAEVLAQKAALAQTQARDAAEKDALMKERERLRLEEQAARLKAAQREAEFLKEREEAAKEAKVQTRLRSMGVCPVGYRWIKQASGYRCAGGSHYISNAELGL
ncbi:P-loop containing nucleoside triphosphate hydrolase protein [Fistulina hepatica ATCC 64428]|uniref:p-loop containing nucleoside triphosphate hydrolase protein n=1 Tax=Fistulina hepatica ATCC 64428 TaxID=1128425 RepID=A0A0D7AFH7_9AGAR|nr:P-loop containing nucleoside triphosphate hydrolase protein [Fistulina hepatica ATCC 64428]